jgi:Ni,Fe-hydrogenase I large subunit
MSRTISIDPVTRVEGHLAIETRIDNGRVVDARVAGRMYRGFEHLLIGRHPIDAARITQRICGICHEVHGIAACIALEDLYGLVPTPNGLILRELILGLHLVTDHIFHFYQLTLPDYLDLARLKQYRGQDERVHKLDNLFRNSAGTFSGNGLTDALTDTPLTVEMALGYVEAISVRKKAGSGLASLGGKVPFCHAILPGGLTTGVTSDRLMNYAHALDQTADFIQRFYLPQAQALATHFSPYFSMGQAHGNFYGNGAFTLLKQPLYTAGVVRKGQKEVALFERIEERVDSTYLDQSGHPQVDKAGAYSWVKAMAYDGAPMEVGPLARLAVNYDAGFMQLLQSFKQQKVQSSVMSRILARAYEAQKICQYLLELLPSYQLDKPTINAPDMQAKPTGTGRSMSMAARGALNHQITAKDGKVTGYQLQVPSAWNFGPSITGQRGTVETALIGTQTPDAQGSSSVEIGRIVRSFDPCLACAIH